MDITLLSVAHCTGIVNELNKLKEHLPLEHHDVIETAVQNNMMNLTAIKKCKVKLQKKKTKMASGWNMFVKEKSRTISNCHQKEKMAILGPIWKALTDVERLEYSKMASDKAAAQTKADAQSKADAQTKDNANVDMSDDNERDDILDSDDENQPVSKKPKKQSNIVTEKIVKQKPNKSKTADNETDNERDDILDSDDENQPVSKKQSNIVTEKIVKQKPKKSKTGDNETDNETFEVEKMPYIPDVIETDDSLTKEEINSLCVDELM